MILDVEISDLDQFGVATRVGDFPTGRVSAGLLTESHNVGNINVDWFSAGTFGQPIDNRHPFIGQNIYRLREGRLEQIGLAWIKHGFLSVNDMCADDPGEFLGVGCFDVYGSFTNSNRQHLGPRSEINPLTGYWEPLGSHFDTGEVGYPAAFPGDGLRSHNTNFFPHDLLDHRIRFFDADVLAADTLSDLFMEGFYVVANDIDIENNFANRRLTGTPPPDAVSEWIFATSGPMDQQPLIDTWGDAVTTASPATEGKVRVAHRVVNLGPDLNRYEYNVFNMNLDRQIESISIPIGSGVVPADIGFNAPLEDEEFHYSQAPWTSAVSGGAIQWSAPAPNAGNNEEFPNTIRFGTMYTFWFTAAGSPVEVDVSLDQSKPGIEGALTAPVFAPCALLTDTNNDGVVDTADLGLLISQFGTAGPTSDFNDDGVVDTADLGLLIAEFGGSCS